jgi:hypothetical protein
MTAFAVTSPLSSVMSDGTSWMTRQLLGSPLLASTGWPGASAHSRMMAGESGVKPEPVTTSSVPPGRFDTSIVPVRATKAMLGWKVTAGPNEIGVDTVSLELSVKVMAHVAPAARWSGVGGHG